MLEVSLIVIGSLISLFLPTLLDGIERKIKAMIHSRIGPPIIQSWYDVFKLFGKELIIPQNSLHTLILIALNFVLQVFILLYLVFTTFYPITSYDLVVVAALFVVLQAVFVSTPFTIPNPFSVIGASREIALVLVNEAFFIIFIGLYVFYTGTSVVGGYLGGITFYLIVLMLGIFINSYVSSGRIPFDIAEAEPELASGLMIEFSGPLLGLFILSLHLKRFFVKFFASILLLSLFIHNAIMLFLTSLGLSIILWIIYSMIAAMLGRSRVDLAPITMLKVYLVLLALSIIGYVLGV